MNLQDMLKFVKIDDSFYAALEEYGKTKNDKLVLEKVLENLFTDYKAITTLTNGLKDKKALDFFIGDKNEDVFLKLRDRLTLHDSLYEINDFMIEVLFNSVYTNGKIYSILYELDHVSNGSRNVHRVTDIVRKRASETKESIVRYLEREIREGDFKYNSSKLKWLDLLILDFNADSKNFILKCILDDALILAENPEKNNTKLILLRSFLNQKFLKEISESLSDELRFGLVKFFNFLVTTIKDRNPQDYNSDSRMFGHVDFFSVLTTLYEKNVPDNVYKLVFKSLLEDGIPEKTVTSRMGKKKEDQIHDNLHLISDRPVFKKYVKKSFEESLVMVKYYKDIYQDLMEVDWIKFDNFNKKNEYMKLAKKWSDRYEIIDSYNGNAVTFRSRYPLVVKNQNHLDHFYEICGKDEVVEHLNDILTLDVRNINHIVPDKHNMTLSGEFANLFSSSAYSNQETIDGFMNYIYDVLVGKNFVKYSESMVSSLYGLYFTENPLFKYEAKSGIFNRDPKSINLGLIGLAEDYKKWDEVAFQKLLSKSFDYSYPQISRELFLTYYKYEDLKDFPSVGGNYFVYDVQSFKKVVKLFNGNPPDDFLSNAIVRSKPFFDNVLMDLLTYAQHNKGMVKNILNIVLESFPNLVVAVRDWVYEETEIRDMVFNTIMENIERNQDPKALPYNVQVMDDGKRKKGLKMLENALVELFPIQSPTVVVKSNNRNNNN